MKRDPVVIIIVAMVVSLMLVLGINLSRHRAPEDEGAQMKGQQAPDFALQSLDGKTIHLSDFRGKAVLLNFWATWCEPCKVEMPWFIQLQNQYASEGLQIVGVAMDDSSEKDIAAFAHNMGVNYPILLGKEGVGNAYGGVQFLPATFYIDRNGKVVDKIFGLRGRSEIEDLVKKIVNEPRVAMKQP